MGEHPDVVTTQRDNEIRAQMIVVELGCAVLCRIAVRAQHSVSALVDPGSDVPVAGAGAGHHELRESRPRSRIWWANIFSAIGDRQMLPVQTNVMCNGPESESDTEHLAQRGDRRHLRERALDLGIVEIASAVSPLDDDGVDAVVRRALDVV